MPGDASAGLPLTNFKTLSDVFIASYTGFVTISVVDSYHPVKGSFRSSKLIYSV